MTERNSPKTDSYQIGPIETRVYQSPLAPTEIPVSLFNAGSEVIKIRFGGNTEYIPLAPGSGITANPDPDVFATVDSGQGFLIVATGVSAFSSGVTSTGSLGYAELQAIAAARTQKQLLTELLLEARLIKQHLQLVTNEELTERDFPEWRFPV